MKWIHITESRSSFMCCQRNVNGDLLYVRENCNRFILPKECLLENYYDLYVISDYGFIYLCDTKFDFHLNYLLVYLQIFSTGTSWISKISNSINQTFSVIVLLHYYDGRSLPFTCFSIFLYQDEVLFPIYIYISPARY